MNHAKDEKQSTSTIDYNSAIILYSVQRVLITDYSVLWDMQSSVKRTGQSGCSLLRIKGVKWLLYDCFGQRDRITMTSHTRPTRPVERHQRFPLFPLLSLLLSWQLPGQQNSKRGPWHRSVEINTHCVRVLVFPHYNIAHLESKQSFVFWGNNGRLHCPSPSGIHFLTDHKTDGLIATFDHFIADVKKTELGPV